MTPENTEPAEIQPKPQGQRARRSRKSKAPVATPTNETVAEPVAPDESIENQASTNVTTAVAEDALENASAREWEGSAPAKRKRGKKSVASPESTSAASKSAQLAQSSESPESFQLSEASESLETSSITPVDPITPFSNDEKSEVPGSVSANEHELPDTEVSNAVAPEPADSEPQPSVETNMEELGRIVEALLFAAEEALGVREMARAAGSDSATVRKVLTSIKETYEQQRRPWDLIDVAGGYRLMTRPEFYPAIERLKTLSAQRKLTQAALETLALIAYRQPLGRAEVESVRGVGAGPVLRQLLDKKLIMISGRGTGLGQPLLYGTTEYFLEHFGLRSIEELPKPGEFKNT